MTTSLSDYWSMLNQHDWTHAMSDDQRVFKAGSAEKKTLLRISNESPEHAKLYAAFSDYIFQGKPKPDKPMEKTFRTGEAG